jgi:hypothetical protein
MTVDNNNVVGDNILTAQPGYDYSLYVYCKQTVLRKKLCI